MIGDEERAARLSAALVERGIYAVSFSYPVVPRGKARIRTQMSAAHSRSDLERAVRAFCAARDSLAEWALA
jgi:glycine C-acetyltransferase